MGEESDGVLIQRREYDILIGFKQARAALTDTLGEPSDDDSVERWDGFRLWGLIRIQTELDRETGTVRYSAWRTSLFQTLEIGVLLTLIALLLTPRLLENYSQSIWLLELIVNNETATDTFQLVLVVLFVSIGLAAFSRGPSPSFDTDGLKERSRVYSLFYFVYLGLGVTVVGVFFGAIFDAPIFVTGIVLALFVLYVYGSRITVRSEIWKYISSSSDSDLSRAKPYALVSLCALLLPIVALISNLLPTLVLPTARASGLSGLIAQVSVPLGFGLLYCYGCLWVLRTIENTTVEPYTSRLPRIVVFVGLLIINLFLILIFMLSFLDLIYSILPVVLLTDLRYNFTDVAAVTGALMLLFGSGLMFSWAYHRLATDEPSPLRHPVALGFRTASVSALFGVFVIGTFLLGNLISLLMFGDGAMLDPSPRTIRLRSETFLFLDSYLGVFPGPSWVAIAGFELLRWFPVLLVGMAWAHSVSKEAQFKFRLRDAAELNTSDRPVPSSVSVKVFDTDKPVAGATRTFRGLPTIVVSQSVVDELAGTARSDTGDALDALLIHELRHLEQWDHLVGLTATLGTLFVGGQNAVLSLYNLQQAERDADLAAVRTVNFEALEAALSGVRRVARTAQSEGHRANKTNPALIGNVAATAQQAAKEAQQHTVSLAIQFKKVVLAPSRLLFSGIIYEYAHQDIPDRLELARLPDTLCQFVAEHTTTTSVVQPEPTSITCYVTREQAVTYLCSRGSHQSEAEQIIESLVEDGRLTEPRPGWLSVQQESQ